MTASGYQNGLLLMFGHLPNTDATPQHSLFRVIRIDTSGTITVNRSYKTKFYSMVFHDLTMFLNPVENELVLLRQNPLNTIRSVFDSRSLALKSNEALTNFMGTDNDYSYSQPYITSGNKKLLHLQKHGPQGIEESNAFLQFDSEMDTLIKWTTREWNLKNGPLHHFRTNPRLLFRCVQYS